MSRSLFFYAVTLYLVTLYLQRLDKAEISDPIPELDHRPRGDYICHSMDVRAE